MLTAGTFCQQARLNDSSCTDTSNSGSLLNELCPLSILNADIVSAMIKYIFMKLDTKMKQHQRVAENKNHNSG